mmetsp:Transcript_98261/g.305597  ORF Transcript_98261/g.305597 Transcript_98261/m.305597 type:complete len:200 (-) Transcript_98261:664-1263(-)
MREGDLVDCLKVHARVLVIWVVRWVGVEALSSPRVEEQDVLGAAQLEEEVVVLVVVARRERARWAYEELRAAPLPQGALALKRAEPLVVQLAPVGQHGPVHAWAKGNSAGIPGPGWRSALEQGRLQVQESTLAVRTLSRSMQEVRKGHREVLTRLASHTHASRHVTTRLFVKVVEVPLPRVKGPHYMATAPSPHVLLEV